jgi:predicted phage terminase large subunit-like protein
MLDVSLDDRKNILLGSLLSFTRTFFELRTGKGFITSSPTSRESHFVSICRALTKVLRGGTKRLKIHIPPRYGKTELVIHFITQALARYPDCNFIYTSYAKTIAERQTAFIRDILNLREYQLLFGVSIDKDKSARDDFKTNKGGSIYAAGTGGAITGMGAGIRGVKDRFSGALIIDDVHKPEDVFSDTIREGDNNWFYNTAISRLNNGADTPIIFIGQRLHEDDLSAHLLEEDGWETLTIPALDRSGNAIYPEMHDKEYLLKLKKLNPYMFASQFQQDPVPAGGGIFKTEWFHQLDIEPEFMCTFVTCDTAETDKSYNDETVFSFWGIYKAEKSFGDEDFYCLHWIDCLNIRIEPHELQTAFMDFYTQCTRYKVKPKFVAIEKKSTGVTLTSTLNQMQGIRIMDIERTVASGNKTARFLSMVPYVAEKRITFTKYSKHANTCIEHMGKITANDSHRHDDICDTCYDAIKIALIDKAVQNMYVNAPSVSNNRASNYLALNLKKLAKARAGENIW